MTAALSGGTTADFDAPTATGHASGLGRALRAKTQLGLDTHALSRTPTHTIAVSALNCA